MCLDHGSERLQTPGVRLLAIVAMAVSQVLVAMAVSQAIFVQVFDF